LIGCGYRLCLVEFWNCVHVDVSSGTRIAERARFGNALAIIRRARASTASIVGKDFACNRAEAPVVRRGHGRFKNCAMIK
jgi:hypothetical protein